MRLIGFIILPILLIGIVAFSQTAISAKPLYLSLPFNLRFTVFNMINTSYVGWNYNITKLIPCVTSHIYIKIIIDNFATNTQIACLLAYVPVSLDNYVYYSPDMGSVFFLINFTSNSLTTISTVQISGLQGPIYNYKGQPTSSITIIPIGYLMLPNGQNVSTSQIFQKYLNGSAVIQSMQDGLAGYYVLYFYT